MVASGLSPERELPAALPTFYNTEPVVTSDYSPQYVGSHGNSPPYFNRGEPTRPGVPLHSPQRGEKGTSSFSGGEIKRKQKEPDKYDGERVEIFTHAFHGFSFYIKNYFINMYENQCRIDNCYICNNI